MDVFSTTQYISTTIFQIETTSNPSTDPGYLLSKATGIRVVSGITCVLSILGSLLIILSYFCFRDLRTTARYILVHLSLTDLGVGLANLIGDAVNFDQYYVNSTNDRYINPSQTVDNLCKAQAFFAEYFTLSSVLWTLCLAVYMHILIINRSRTHLKYLVWFFYAFCYLMPLLISVWMLGTNRLGYAPYDSAGWCSIISVKPHFQFTVLSQETYVDTFSDIFGYYLWIYLTIVLTLLLYISVFCYVRLEFYSTERDQNISARGFWQAMDNIDYKFILIPLMFIFLRIWSIIIHILLVYIQVPPKSVPSWILQLLVYFSGFGDSGQGLVNAILFVVFSSRVRQHLCWCCLRKSKDGNTPLPTETQSLFKKSLQPDGLYSDSKRYNATHSGAQLSMSTTLSINAD